MKHRHAAVIVTLLLVLTAVGCTVNPVTGKSQLDLMGEAQEVALGAELYPSYTQMSLGLVPEPELQSYVDAVGQRLAAVGHRPALPYSFNAVNDPSVNAYALPGGKISITRGLLARLHTEDELAAVLGHETGHVTARHAAQQYTRTMLLQLAMVGGEIYMEAKETRHREIYRIGGLLGAQLTLARYSREQERQADELGLDYMVKAGYNPQGLVGVMEVLEEQQRRKPNLIERMFASHPMTAERIATARQAVAAQPAELTGRPLKQAPYERATAQVRSARDAYDRLADAQGLLADDKAAQARSLLSSSVNEWPQDGLLRAFLAAAHLELEEKQQALSNAARAAETAPDIFFVQYLAGQIHLKEKRYQRALQLLDRAEAVLPDRADVALMKGQALEGLGKKSEAIAQYQRVAQLAPDSEAAQEAAKRLQALGAK